MFSSKTNKLLISLDRYKWKKRKFIVFKPKMDDRYSIDSIRSHSGISIAAFCVETGDELYEKVKERADTNIIAVDEAFMIKGAADALKKLYFDGYTVLVSSLQLSSANKPFDEIAQMLPYATEIQVCSSVCTVCGSDAYYTMRKTKDEKEIIVGGAEMYEPRCNKHYEQLVKSE
tara:strand:+ start:35544 stop:36065 length:522 start_codon:yes stop_codon:yes gene_type:complete